MYRGVRAPWRIVVAKRVVDSLDAIFVERYGWMEVGIYSGLVVQVRECSDWLFDPQSCVLGLVLLYPQSCVLSLVLSFLFRSVLQIGTPENCDDSFLYTSFHSRILPTMTLAVIFEVSRDFSCRRDMMAVRSSQFRMQRLVYFLFRPSALASRVSHNALRPLVYVEHNAKHNGTSTDDVESLTLSWPPCPGSALVFRSNSRFIRRHRKH